ncbi:MAG: hypothetical protein Q4C64_08645 [Erysipelotrichia bacterium]|nr:hypothetical protein [Erysipelotrichia bacterium]
MLKNAKWIIGTVAQLLLVIIVVPVVMKFFSFFINFETMADKAQSVCFKMIASIPCFNTWLKLMKDFCDWSSSDNANLFNELVMKNKIITTGVAGVQIFFQSVMTAFISKVFKAVHKMLSGYGAPIISTFLGVIVSTVVTYFMNKNQSMASIIISNVLLLGIMIVGFFFMFKSVFGSLRMRKSVFVLDLIVTGLSAVITSFYLTVMVFAVNNCVGGRSQAISTCLAITVVEIINLVLCTLLSLAYDKDKERGIIS